MQKYTKPDVAYTLVMLEEAGFIKAVIDYGCDEISELDVIVSHTKVTNFLKPFDQKTHGIRFML